MMMRRRTERSEKKRNENVYGTLLNNIYSFN
jgi:hypothetical protein